MLANGTNPILSGIRSVFRVPARRCIIPFYLLHHSLDFLDRLEDHEGLISRRTSRQL